MQWLNIHIPDLQSEEFLGSEPVARATWLSLLSYCANQENGGIIDGASSWSDRMCQQVLGVTKNELHTDTQLFTHADDCVTVWAYPVDQEAAVQAKREGGRIGGLRKAKNRLAKPVAKPQANLQGELLGELLGKGKERKGKKGKEYTDGDMFLSTQEGEEPISNREKRKMRMEAARRKGTHTATEWAAMVEYHGGRCVACGSPEKICRDHIIPIYQGGSDSIDNLQPMCSSCNSSKGADSSDLRLSGWRDSVKATPKKERVVIDPAIKARIGGWFGRRESTQWSDKEIKALKALGDITEDLDQMEALYESKDTYNRKQIQTLLNNWQGEMDRARQFVAPIRKQPINVGGNRDANGKPIFQC